MIEDTMETPTTFNELEQLARSFQERYPDEELMSIAMMTTDRISSGDLFRIVANELDRNNAEHFVDRFWRELEDYRRPLLMLLVHNLEGQLVELLRGNDEPWEAFVDGGWL